MAIFVNYSKRFFGRNVAHVYFVVVTLLFGNLFFALGSML